MLDCSYKSNLPLFYRETCFCYSKVNTVKVQDRFLKVSIEDQVFLWSWFQSHVEQKEPAWSISTVKEF